MKQFCPTLGSNFFLTLLLLTSSFLTTKTIDAIPINNNVPDGINFYLYTPQQPDHPQLIDINDDASSLMNAGYNNSFQLKILCHGFTKNYLADPGILSTLKSAYFACAERSTNVIGIDWTKHAQRTPNDTTVTTVKELGQIFNTAYVQAVQYIETVGQVTAQLVNFLVTRGGTPLEKIHLLGFSLGSHTMGFAGHFYGQQFGGKKIGRITALDPSGPCFNHNLPLNYLLPDLNCTAIYRHIIETDADFVDAIHTGANLLGNEEPLGHADFYVNGGYVQPNCGSSDLEDTLTSCSHRRAILLYAESICNDRTFKAIKNCAVSTGNVHDVLKKEDDDCCDPNEIVYMGEYTEPSVRGTFFVRTNGRPPFSQY